MQAPSLGAAIMSFAVLIAGALVLRWALGWFLQLHTLLRLTRENNAMLRSLHVQHGWSLPAGVESVKQPALIAARAAVRARFARKGA